MTFNVAENIRKVMGWCPNMSQKNHGTENLNLEALPTNKGTIPPQFSPLILENTYVAGVGIVKEGIIAIIFFVTVFLISITSGYNSFFFNYGTAIILLSVLLLPFVASRTTIEINDKNIKVRTMFHRIVGTTTRPLESIQKVYVQSNKMHKFAYFGLFIVGTLWLILSLWSLFEGKTLRELNQNLAWIVFSFGYGYFLYMSAKTVYSIQIKFDPHPSINRIQVFTKNAQQIADILDKDSKNKHNLNEYHSN